MAKSGWKCARCLYAGVIEHDATADVYTVFNLLDNAHVAANGGTCTDTVKVRAWKIPVASEQAAEATSGT